MTSNFCSYPFEHFSIGQNSELRACCVAKSFGIKIQDVSDLSAWWRDHEDYNQLRDSHRNNEKHPKCATCWQQESSGFTSMRNLVTHSSSDRLELKNIEITGGRLCNLACRMCSKVSSNQIERENRPWDSGHPAAALNWLDDPAEQDKLLKILMTPSLRSIYFTGGEPQIMPCYQQLLSKWAEQRDLNSLAMHLNTNCTVFNEQFWELINRFHHKQIDFSIDAVDDVYENIRFTDFSKVKVNMLRIRDYLTDKGRNVMSLAVVIQLANVDQGMEMQTLYDELKSLDRPMLEYQLLLLPVTNNPEWSWHNIPVEILSQARNRLSGDGEVVSRWCQYLDNAISNNSFNLQHARDVINKERWFKENNGRCLWDIRPDWYEIYKDNN